LAPHFLHRGLPNVPTPVHRNLVKLLAGRGIPQEHIRQLILNPQTGKPLSIKTLERAFTTEIKTAKVELNLRVGRFIGAGWHSKCVNEFGAHQMEGTWWTAKFDVTPMLWDCWPNRSTSINPMIGRTQERP
jgi:hypothetical protein